MRSRMVEPQCGLGSYLNISDEPGKFEERKRQKTISKGPAVGSPKTSGNQRPSEDKKKRTETTLHAFYFTHLVYIYNTSKAFGNCLGWIVEWLDLWVKGPGTEECQQKKTRQTDPSKGALGY